MGTTVPVVEVFCPHLYCGDGGRPFPFCIPSPNAEREVQAWKAFSLFFLFSNLNLHTTLYLRNPAPAAFHFLSGPKAAQNISLYFSSLQTHSQGPGRGGYKRNSIGQRIFATSLGLSLHACVLQFLSFLCWGEEELRSRIPLYIAGDKPSPPPFFPRSAHA